MIYLCSIFHVVLDRITGSLGKSARNRDDYLQFDNTSSRLRCSEWREKVVLFFKKVKSVVTKWRDKKLGKTDKVLNLKEKRNQHYNANILQTVGSDLLKEFGYHPKPNYLFNRMEILAVQNLPHQNIRVRRNKDDQVAQQPCQQMIKTHFACTCSNSCNTSSFRYCRNRYDKQYDFKYGVWSRTTSSISSAQCGDENWNSLLVLKLRRKETDPIIVPKQNKAIRKPVFTGINVIAIISE
ncbi:hypothetical protein WDU94_004999 [Cyamophila willieti]